MQLGVVLLVLSSFTTTAWSQCVHETCNGCLSDPSGCSWCYGSSTCGFSSSSNCSSVSYSGDASGCPVSPQPAPACSHQTCSGCVNDPSGSCGWCGATQACASVNSPCVYGLQTASSSTCVAPSCSSATSCSSCLADNGCSWCSTYSSCMSANSSCPASITSTVQCPSQVCPQINDCYGCTATTGCGWCGNGQYCGSTDSGSCATGFETSSSQCSSPPSGPTNCSAHSTCFGCSNDPSQTCGWCAAEASCISTSSAYCTGGLVGAGAACPTCSHQTCTECEQDPSMACAWCLTSSSCAVYQPNQAACSEGGYLPSSSTCAAWDFPTSCSQASDCTSCSELSNCGWCSPSQLCVPTQSELSLCPTPLNSFCPYCGNNEGCSECSMSQGCGWCATDNVCTEGSSQGSYVSDSSCYMFSNSTAVVQWSGLQNVQCRSNRIVLLASVIGGIVGTALLVAVAVAIATLVRRRRAAEVPLGVVGYGKQVDAA
jgi:hypothetical protein